MRIEIDYAEATFKHEGQTFEAIGGVIHNTTTEDVGIGSYEFWGQRGYDKQIVEVSEYEEAEFTGTDIYLGESTTPLVDPSPALVEAAQEALYSKTYELAEERAAEAA
jgi:hypothetical protein